MAVSLIVKKLEASNVPMLAVKILDNAKRIDRMNQNLLNATMIGMRGNLKFDLLNLVQETTIESAVVRGNRPLVSAPVL